MRRFQVKKCLALNIQPEHGPEWLRPLWEHVTPQVASARQPAHLPRAYLSTAPLLTSWPRSPQAGSNIQRRRWSLPTTATETSYFTTNLPGAPRTTGVSLSYADFIYLFFFLSAVSHQPIRSAAKPTRLEPGPGPGPEPHARFRLRRFRTADAGGARPSRLTAGTGSRSTRRAGRGRRGLGGARPPRLVQVQLDHLRK